MKVKSSLYAQLRDLRDRGALLAGIEAVQNGSTVVLTYYLTLDGKTERLMYEAQDGSCPSMIQLFGSADYLERALHKSYGLKFVGNPNLEAGL